MAAVTVDTEDDRRVRGWLAILLEAEATHDVDMAVEAREELDRLLRADVVLA